MRAFLLVVTALFAFSPSRTGAEELAPGLTYEVSNGYHVVVADFARIHVRANHPKAGAGQDFKTVEQHAAEEGAIVAINANYFDSSKGGVCGVARGFGQDFTRTYQENTCSTTMGWNGVLAEIFSGYGHEEDPTFQPAMTEMVTGGGTILKSGAPANWYEVSLPAGRAMTAVGVTADRSQFVFLVTDKGRSSLSRMQSTFTAHGVVDAVFLDGGGSTRLWIQGRGYVNVPEGADRNVPAVVLAIVPPAIDAGFPASDAGSPDGAPEAPEDGAAITQTDSGPSNAADAGEAEVDGGASDGGGHGEIAPGCGCQGTGGASGWQLPGLLLLATSVRQRRPRRVRG